MKYLPVLAIVFISLCAGLPQSLGLPALEMPLGEEPGVSIIDQGSPDVYFRAQVIPLEVKSERSINLFFELRNKNSFDLENVNVRAYDVCIFDPNGQEVFIPNLNEADEGVLKPNETKTWRWKWEADKTELDKDCEIKFLVEYDGEYYLSQDVIVLSESEYEIREIEERLQAIPAQSFSSNTPLRISLSFSEEQPFLEDIDYLMYIDYYNMGNGFITLNKNYPVKIQIPENIESLVCEDYTKAEILKLDKTEDLKFIRNKAPRTICDLKTKDIDEEISIRPLTLTAKYKYVLDNSILVRVKR